MPYTLNHTPTFRNNQTSPKGQGLGGVYTRRHRKLKKDNILAISKSSIRKLARRGGVKRLSCTIYDDARSALKDRLSLILRRISLILDSTRPVNNLGLPISNPAVGGDKGRKTVTTRDVVYALNGLGFTMYGFEWPEI